MRFAALGWLLAGLSLLLGDGIDLGELGPYKVRTLLGILACVAGAWFFFEGLKREIVAAVKAPQQEASPHGIREESK